MSHIFTSKKFLEATELVVKAVGVGAVVGLMAGEADKGAKVGGLLGVGALISAAGERERKRAEISHEKGPDIA